MSLNCSVCGVDCTKCNLLGDTCKGCDSVQGKVFWSVHFGGICPIYDCVVNKKQLASCAECSDLPCDIYFATKDPSMTDEEHTAGIKARVDILKNNN